MALCKEINDIINEIKHLAEFHSVEVPCVYGDGTCSFDKVVTLDELNKILYEVSHSE